ncbi:MAG: hypothetical protein ABJ000_19250 [Saccharospirillum sp.]|uniref:hypothetical protein n=1 Tax=Saccharospirillum sp. TaxID=2033801 RepID=UPI003298391B
MNRKPQQGVALVAVIFLIVVIGAALVVISRLSISSSAQVTQNLLQSRARQAASAGLEWATQRLVEEGSGACVANTTVTVPAYSDYTVTVRCTEGRYNRPNPVAQRVYLYRLTAQAAFGNLNDANYVWTHRNATVEL